MNIMILSFHSLKLVNAANAMLVNT